MGRGEGSAKREKKIRDTFTGPEDKTEWSNKADKKIGSVVVSSKRLV